MTRCEPRTACSASSSASRVAPTAPSSVAALGALRLGEREQQVLGRDVLVAERLRFLLGLVEDLVQLARERRLRVALLGNRAVSALDLLAELRDVDAELLEDGHDDALVLRQQGEQQMEVVDERIAGAPGQRDGLVERFGGFDGQTVGD